jgi:glycosyltransferase domain-containing protein
MEIKPINNKELEKLSIVILSKDRSEELNQIINYWSKTPSTIIIIHDTQVPLNSHNFSSNVFYVNSKAHILDRLEQALNYIFTPYAVICNDDEIFLIDPLLKFIDYLEHEKDIEAVGGQVLAYNWAGNQLLANKIYPFLDGYSNTDRIPINRIKNTFGIKNVMDLTLVYRSEQFRNIVNCTKNFSKFTTPVMYETMFAFFSSYYCRSIRLKDIYWMRNWFTPFQHFDTWDRKLTWSEWCDDQSFEAERTNWRNQFILLLKNKTDFSDSQSESLAEWLLQWKAIGENKNDSKESTIWVILKNFAKLMIPKFFLWRVKKFLPIMRKNMMPDFASLINMNNNYNHISSKDLENFKIFVHEQKILLKK